MKNTLVLAFLSFFLVSGDLLAKIPDGCMPNLNQIIKNHNEFEQNVPLYLADGDFTPEQVESVRQTQASVLEVVALLCAGLRKVELQSSLANKVGLVSQKKAEREAQKSYNEAIEYYLANTSK
jgi:hypothetical protein